MRKILLLIFALLPSSLVQATPLGLKIGVLAFGTVSWELAAMTALGLDRQYSLDVQVTQLASPDAGKIGLQANSLDIIATDWIWVAQQHSTGADYRFIPYSTHAGALMAPANSAIKTPADLAGHKLGVVGGALDKNWVLLRAYARKLHGLDLEKSAEPVYGAPPLLISQLTGHRLDALLTYWNDAVRLEARGYGRLLDGREVLHGLGVNEPLANLGYVFHQSWASAHEPALLAFLKATEQARERLCTDAAVWDGIADLTREPDPAVRATLRKEYCAGRVQRFGEKEIAAAEKVYGLLRETGGAEATGKEEKLPREIFWKARDH
jgi:NitT/TauT family transport system substrate-binding protein